MSHENHSTVSHEVQGTADLHLAEIIPILHQALLQAGVSTLNVPYLITRSTVHLCVFMEPESSDEQERVEFIRDRLARVFKGVLEVRFPEILARDSGEGQFVWKLVDDQVAHMREPLPKAVRRLLAPQ